MTPRGVLTERQRDCLDVILESVRRGAGPPTIRHIGHELNVRSPNAVLGHLRALARKGYLDWPETWRRGQVRVLRDQTGRRIGGWAPEYEAEP